MNDPREQIYEQLVILRCQAGDEDALAELVARYSPGLRLFLTKVSGQPPLADDLLQETWFDAYRRINSLRNPAAFPTWLYRIARDKAYRELRRRRVPLEPFDESLADVPDEEDQQFSPEDAATVRAAMDQIAVEQREVLMLRFVEGMSYEQIADVLQRPLGTVRSRIHYAKLALRAKLESNQPERKVTP